MKLSLELSYQTPKEWAEQVVENFDPFLQDHADCERKASTMALSLVAKAPEKTKIIPGLIDTALEELEHFKMVYALMEKRGVPLPKEMEKDLYIQDLMKECRSDSRARYLDRLLLGSIVECRGAERFKLVCDALEDPELKEFY
ncbi:MAG: tRNA isopentenyl-2-thiomethyl-A-37 hydroxylase MiaE, partial [Luteibaculum sp.]